MSTTQHVAILNTKGIGRNGQLIEYATDAQALAAIERFGHAVSVERVEDARGVVLYRVACADERGDRGSYRMHSIACAHRIPVYCP